MLELLTASTPNGWKASIALEEMGLPYSVRPINLSAHEQKEPWFYQLNPNGRIPVIIDHDHDDLVVFESGAILLYLAELTGQFLPEGRRERYHAIEWLMFQMGGIGPMMGQANVFFRYAPERIDYAIERYQRECRRLFEVLNGQLQQSPFLAGEDYSIADIANWSWVHTYEWSGVNLEGLPHLQRWIDEIALRPAVQRGRNIPHPPDFSANESKSLRGHGILV